MTHLSPEFFFRNGNLTPGYEAFVIAGILSVIESVSIWFGLVAKPVSRQLPLSSYHWQTLRAGSVTEYHFHLIL